MSDVRAYSVVEGWEQLPPGFEHRDVAGVAVDGENRVFLICRGDHPVLVYDDKGSFLRSWGEGIAQACFLLPWSRRCVAPPRTPVLARGWPG